MRNFLNPAVTIHERHQKLKALHETKIRISTVDFYPVSAESGAKNAVMKNRPPHLIDMSPSDRPYSLRKNILRKLEGRRDLYFDTYAFYKDSSDVVICEGMVLRKKMVCDGETRTKRFLKNNSLFALEACFTETCVYISFNDLHYSNDFIFKHNQTMYLLEWIC